MAYLASVAGYSARELFDAPLHGPDQQTQLEAVIAIGETATPEAVGLLSDILYHRDHPYFNGVPPRGAWDKLAGEAAISKLIQLFRDVDVKLREEALDRIVSIGQDALPAPSDDIDANDKDLAAGCAERPGSSLCLTRCYGNCFPYCRVRPRCLSGPSGFSAICHANG